MIKSLEKVSTMREKLLTALCISLLPSFTFCVFAPLTLYLTNINEFWFSVFQMLPSIILVFLLSFCLFAGLTFLCSLKKFQIPLVAVFAFGLMLYVEGNFLPSDYGLLDGSEIPWEEYKAQGIINSVIWIVMLLLPFITYFILNKRAIRAMKYIAVFIVAIQAVTLTFMLCTTPLEKETRYLSNIGKFELSKNHNVIIFVLDAFDMAIFDSIYEESPEFFDPLEGFNIFTDVVGSYPTTKGALPFLLTGEYYNNSEEYKAYIKNAWERSPLLHQLVQKSYNINVYTSSTYVDMGRDDILSNIGIAELSTENSLEFTELLYKFVSFRYAPHTLKSQFWLYTGDFDQFDKRNRYGIDDITFFSDLTRDTVKTTKEGNSFHFYHLYGAHPPFIMDENINFLEDNTGSALEQGKGALNIVYKYIQLLKREAAYLYADATIIITADHGASGGAGSSPILMIKRRGRETGLHIQEYPVSQDEIHATIEEEIGAKLSDTRTLFETEGRADYIRKFYCYAWDDSWDSSYLPAIVELDVVGSAEDVANYNATGVVYVPPKGTKRKPTITMGETIFFKKNSEKHRELFIYGIESVDSNNFAWSLGKKTILSLCLDKKPSGDVCVQLGHADIAGGKQQITVRHGEKMLLEEVVFSGNDAFTFVVSKEEFDQQGIILTIEYSNPIIPALNGDSPDQRELAIRYSSVTVSLVK